MIWIFSRKLGQFSRSFYWDVDVLVQYGIQNILLSWKIGTVLLTNWEVIPYDFFRWPNAATSSKKNYPTESRTLKLFKKPVTCTWMPFLFPNIQRAVNTENNQTGGEERNMTLWVMFLYRFSVRRLWSMGPELPGFKTVWKMCQKIPWDSLLPSATLEDSLVLMRNSWLMRHQHVRRPLQSYIVIT